jgi:hypothetical protein
MPDAAPLPLKSQAFLSLPSCCVLNIEIFYETATSIIQFRCLEQCFIPRFAISRSINTTFLIFEYKCPTTPTTISLLVGFKGFY